MRPRGTFFGGLFPIHPQPLPDELLTSWLMRTAHANGMKLQHFLDVVLGRGAPTLTRDYDRSVPEQHLERFSEATGIPVVRLRECTLRKFSGTFVREINTKTVSPWILAAGVHHRKRFLHGLQYCPACLATDLEPYFRTAWRLAFYVECAQHHVQMLDACWRCDAPVVPHRTEQGQRRSTLSSSARTCHACGADLARGFQSALHAPDLEVQLAMSSLAAYGWFAFSVFRFRQTDASVDIYSDLHKLCHLVYSRRRKLCDLGHAVRELVGYAPGLSRLASFNIESARIADRLEAISLGLWLLTNWPNRLHTALQCARLSNRRLRNAYVDWSAELLRSLGNCHAVRTSSETPSTVGARGDIPSLQPLR